jgi:hypothetical protein
LEAIEIWKLEIEKVSLLQCKFDRKWQLPPKEQVYRSKVQVELYNLNVEEENYRYQRAHEKWLLEGDQNTDYFHMISNCRKRKDHVQSMEDNGVLIKETTRF